MPRKAKVRGRGAVSKSNVIIRRPRWVVVCLGLVRTLENWTEGATTLERDNTGPNPAVTRKYFRHI